MTTVVDIKDFHKDEDVDFSFVAEDCDGSPLPNASSYTPYMTFSYTEGGDSVLTVSTPNFTFQSGSTWDVAITEAELSPIIEGKTFYHNIWLKPPTGQEHLQCKGQFVLLPSIATGA